MNPVTVRKVRLLVILFGLADISPTRGYHPEWDDGTSPYTSPVGTFAPNGYGLYDMIGNLNEKCWDWWQESYPSDPQTDPHGPSEPDLVARAYRGGSCGDYARHSRNAYRWRLDPANGLSSYHGFRVALGQ